MVVGAISEPGAFSVTPAGCDLIELRLDSLGSGEDVRDYARSCPVPVLATARGEAEGGLSPWSPAERARAYRDLFPFASLIDIELRDFDELDEVISEARAQDIVVVGSYHDFEKTPSIEELIGNLDDRADLHKFALMTGSADDISSHLELIKQLGNRPFSVMGMGPMGAAARPLMAKCGSLLNYGYLGQTPTAPNQWSAKLLAETLNL